MKYDKWTVALSALGLVSAAALARAEESQTSVLTQLASTTISGYVDTSAQWNIGTGDQRLPDYKFGGSSKADGFNLDVVQLRIESPLEETTWAAGYRVDLWMGPDADTLGTQSILASGPSDFAIRQAYVALRVPIQNGIDIKAGVFDSVLGYESVDAGSDPNYTRSYGNTIEPQTNTGMVASYRFSEAIIASAGIADTVGPTINERAQGPNSSANTKAESFKTYMGAVAVSAPDSFGFLAGSTLYGGIVNGFSSDYGENQTSYYVGAIVATPVTGLRCGAAFDDLDVHNLSGETWAVAGYTSYQATEKLSLHFRGEYLRDRGQQKFFVDSTGDTNPDEVLTLTATAQYDLWRNVISRVELRWDHSLSGQTVWGTPSNTGSETNPGSTRNEWLLAANFIYRF